MKKIINNYWHIAIILLLSLTPFIWFLGKSDFLVNGIDTNFPLNPITWIYRRFFVWDALINAGFHFSSTIAGVFFHTLQVIPHILGFSLHNVEYLSFIFWFSGTVIASWCFAKLVLPNSKPTQLLLVCFYSFNTYLFNTWENVKVANLALAVSLPLALSVLYLLREKRISLKVALFLSMGVGLIASGSGINPSYILSLFLACLLFSTGFIVTKFNWRQVVEVLRDLIVFFMGIFLANLFWILPTAYYVISSVPASQSLQGIGFTNWVDSLSQNTSLFNVLRLQGAWDWYALDGSGAPYYIPYALKYFKHPIFIAFSVAIPLLALFSSLFIEKSKKALYISLLLMVLIGVFLGAGTHPPTGIIFAWLVNHVPFFGIFRSPWYIFTSFLTLAYASLIALFFSRLENKWKITARILIGLLFIGNLFYNYPLISGKIFRPGRQDGFYVRFPDYVFDSLDWVNKNNTGRILGYPDDEIEQFEWGYRGVESILQLGSNKEVLYMPLYLVDTPVIKVISQLYIAVKKNQETVVANIIPKLGVQTLFYKSDQKSIRIALPEIFKKYPLTQFGKWFFYDLSSINPLGKIFPVSNYYFVYPFTKAEKALSVLDNNSIILNPEDSVAYGISEIYKKSGIVLTTSNSQVSKMEEFLTSKADIKTIVPVTDFDRVEYKFKVPVAGSYSPVLEGYKLDEFGIDKSKQVLVNVNGIPTFLEPLQVGDYIKYKKISLNEGENSLVIQINTRNFISESDFINVAQNKENVSKTVDVEMQNGNRFLSLTNFGDEDLKVDYRVKNFDPLSKYYISFDYQRIYGDKAKLNISQFSDTSPMKIQSETAPNFPEWKNYHTYFEPVPTKSSVTLSLQIDKTPTSMSNLSNSNDSIHSYGTKVYYDNLKFVKIFTNELMFVADQGVDKVNNTSITYKKINPVKYVGEVKNSNTSNSIVFLENYSPDWAINFKTLDGKSFKPKIAHFTGDLYANVWYVKNVPEEYEFTIYYWPQSLLYIGAVGTVLSFLLVSTILLLEHRKKIHK